MGVGGPNVGVLDGVSVGAFVLVGLGVLVGPCVGAVVGVLVGVGVAEGGIGRGKQVARSATKSCDLRALYGPTLSSVPVRKWLVNAAMVSVPALAS